uniref:Uncharacterized protein n=1 Tax=viral metagenome TaxID=1070528 RepID=A0A6C0L3Z1_9ZZZZ|tara:strand:- start:6608 stop:7003 length:396 start_codon:yes stop_codon:yes gene_type:complete
MELGCPLDVAFQGIEKKKKEKKKKTKPIPEEPENVLPYTPEENKEQYSELKEEKEETNNNVIQLTNEEYEAFKKYQLERYIQIREKGMQEQYREGFSNVNDDFNDVLLFGLMGIFFLIFTDYVYKLGKRSY